MTFEKEGSRLRIDCDYVAGCDGYHGVSRPSIPSSMLRTYKKSYPFGWLGIMSETPPFPDLCYCYHRRGFALASMRKPMLSRYYIQCDPGRTTKGLARTTASGRSSRRDVRRDMADSIVCDRPFNRKIHCTVTKFRYRADALWGSLMTALAIADFVRMDEVQRSRNLRTRSRTSKSFSCLFADNLKRLFVGAQPQEGGMPHLAVTRPLGEFYLAHELGNEPGGCFLVLHFFGQRVSRRCASAASFHRATSARPRRSQCRHARRRSSAFQSPVAYRKH